MFSDKGEDYSVEQLEELRFALLRIVTKSDDDLRKFFADRGMVIVTEPQGADRIKASLFMTGKH